VAHLGAQDNKLPQVVTPRQTEAAVAAVVVKMRR
jgi:hypothetical protein